MELEMKSGIEVNICYLPSNHYSGSLTDDGIVYLDGCIIALCSFILRWLC